MLFILIVNLGLLGVLLRADRLRIQGDFETLKNTQTYDWQNEVIEMFNKAVDQADQQGLHQSNGSSINTFQIQTCSGKNISKQYSNVSLDLITFIRLENDPSKDYIAYSDICDTNISLPNGTKRYYGGIIFWNIYQQYQHFNIHDQNDYKILVQIMVRELLHITCANEIIMNLYQTATFTDADPTVYLPGMRLIQFNTTVTNWIDIYNCSGLQALPIIPAKYGTGFFFPYYLFPNSILAYNSGYQKQMPVISFLEIPIINFATPYLIFKPQQNPSSQFDYMRPIFKNTTGCNYIQTGCLNSDQSTDIVCSNVNSTLCSQDYVSIRMCPGQIEGLSNCRVYLPVVYQNTSVASKNYCSKCFIWLQTINATINQTISSINCSACPTDMIAVPPKLDICINKTQDCEVLVEEPSTYYSWNSPNDYQHKCKTCITGKHTSYNQTLCLLSNITFCSQYNDYDCIQCQSNMKVYSNVCYWNIQGCLFQYTDLCFSCQPGYQASVSNFNQNTTCSQCPIGYSLAPPDFSRCQISIQNCRQIYSYGNSYECWTCYSGYHQSSDNQKCYPIIAGCNTYNQQNGVDFCTQCYNGYHLSDDQKSCFQNIDNCLYHIGKLCSVCQQNTRISLDRLSCWLNIVGCLNYSEANCLQCDTGYTLYQGWCYTLQNCYLNVSNLVCTQCKMWYQQTTVNLNMNNRLVTKVCNPCGTNMIAIPPNLNTCTQSIQDCLVLLEEPDIYYKWNYYYSYATKCKNCTQGKHLSVDQRKCIQDVFGCLNHSDYSCIQCQQNMLLQSDVCFWQITGCYYQYGDICQSCQQFYKVNKINGNVTTNTPANLTCTKCQPGYAALPTNKNNCTYAIMGCDTFTYNYSELICQQCVQSYHLAQKQTLCYADIQGCLNYSEDTNQSNCSLCASNLILSSDQKLCYVFGCESQNETYCTSCQDNMILQNGSCYWMIDGCVNQTQDICLDCVPQYKVTVSQIDNVTSNLSCSKCQGGYAALPKDPQTCVFLIQNCSSIILNESYTGCESCDEGYHLSQDQKLCFQNLKACATYSDELCDTCDEGYLLQNEICWQSLFGCQNQINDTCIQCKSNFVSSTVSPSDQNLTCSKCSDPSNIVSISNLCIVPVMNCSVYARHNNTCLLCDEGFYLDIFRNECLPPIENCLLRSINQTHRCAVCEENTQLLDGRCYSCSDPYCVDCNSSTCDKCLTPFNLNEQYQCTTECQDYYYLYDCVECEVQEEQAQCTKCYEGFYIQNTSCASCSERFPNCVHCNSTWCQTCSEGYYLNSTTEECNLCSQLTSNCLQCTEEKCLICSQGYASKDGECISCQEIVNGSDICNYLTPATPMSVAYSCLENYYHTGDIEDACISCERDFGRCVHCNNETCLICADGFRFNSSVCVQCPDACQTCDENDVCTSCPLGTVTKNQTCDASIENFTISETTPNNEVATYVDKKQLELTNSSEYSVMGEVDEQGQFCTIDSQCNDNGKCLITSCECLEGYFGTRCQYSINDSQQISNFTLSVVSFLYKHIKVQNYSDFISKVNISFVISDCSPIMLAGTIEKFILVIGRLVKYYSQNYQIIESWTTQKLLATVGALTDGVKSNNFSNQTSIGLLQDYTQQIIGAAQYIQLETPFQATIAGKNNLNDSVSKTQFETQFNIGGRRRMLQTDSNGCTNYANILKPQITLGQDVYDILKTSLNNNEQLSYELSYYFTNPRFNKSQELKDYSALVRVEFFTKIKQININNVEPIQIIIPKKDLRYADINTSYQCVTWNDSTKQWTEEGIYSNMTVHCLNYTKCFTTHLSDFMVILNATQTHSYLKEQTENELYTNASLWLSTTWLLFFISLTLYNKKSDKNSRSVQVLNITVHSIIPDTDKGFDIQVLESVPDAGGQTIRVQNKVLSAQRQEQNTWMAYPLLSLIRPNPGTSVQIQVQKICLLVLQLQMFTFLTSVFIYTNPFVFTDHLDQSMDIYYYLITISITWVSNYIFGFLAVSTRSQKDVSKIFYLIWLMIYFGLTIVGIYLMFDLDSNEGGYLVLGVGVEILIDMIALDLLVAYVCSKFLQNDEESIILDFVRKRGFL